MLHPFWGTHTVLLLPDAQRNGAGMTAGALLHAVRDIGAFSIALLTNEIDVALGQYLSNRTIPAVVAPWNRETLRRYLRELGNDGRPVVLIVGNCTQPADFELVAWLQRNAAPALVVPWVHNAIDQDLPRVVVHGVGLVTNEAYIPILQQVTALRSVQWFGLGLAVDLPRLGRIREITEHPIYRRYNISPEDLVLYQPTVHEGVDYEAELAFAEALAALANQGDMPKRTVHLLVPGGPPRETLRRRDRVRLIFQDPTDEHDGIWSTRALYAAADMVILAVRTPQLRSPFTQSLAPLSPLEAMAVCLVACGSFGTVRIQDTRPTLYGGMQYVDLALPGAAQQAWDLLSRPDALRSFIDANARLIERFHSIPALARRLSGLPWG